MASEMYRKVGRGGAGNYYSPQDIDEAAKRINEDVEAQEAVKSTLIDNTKATQSNYAHQGRGGAGNYQSTSLANAPGIPNDLSTSVKQTVVPEGGHIGRGGAGNFVSGDVERRKSDAERRLSQAQERIHAQTVEDVGKEMKIPEKAHLGSEKLGDLYRQRQDTS